ncbi:hypothetical protein FB45DRAFT_1053325 [Roridomyces roridus]|uniref:F-box domain-containing protein n=1 Tax=Roridomyces roridus TaxID=1738132 RepID=A0AAD7CCI6_9AGAR|nr:hypothetical protein FB45DRAFT_1053325 [Roridomyces roridus]
MARGLENQLRGLIQASEANIADIDSLVVPLLRVRDREQNNVATLKLILAPIRKFPFELLSHVFTMVVNSVDRWDDDKATWLKQALTISHVCAQWKQLTCATPKLWNRHLDIALRSRESRGDTALDLDRAKTVLDRSAPLPFSITLSGDFSDADSPLNKLVMNSAQRWKSLCLSEVTVSHLRDLPMISLDALEHLEVESCLHPDGSPCLEPLNLFLNSPRLRAVDLAGPHTDHIRIPWFQLTQLKISNSGRTVFACLDILERCSNLVTAKLSGIVLDPSPGGSPTSTRIITLTRLETLDANLRITHPRWQGQPITPFFGRLALPALTRLTISINLRMETLWSLKEFAAFQHRCPSIEHLTIRGTRMTPESLVSLLRESPGLVELDLDQCFSDVRAQQALLEYLEYSSTRIAHPVVRLKRFSIASDKLDETALEHLIRSRWWTATDVESPPVARWETIEIRTDDLGRLSDSFKTMVRQRKEEGLQVKIYDLDDDNPYDSDSDSDSESDT